ncbi:hypothetical protein E2C01_010501 [Portunus trituberculatus]|uniref:Uncharacterized protein n=1 Tax=Portunus trituberculatus TaxID=210409 RepID=A0A5B7D8J9_PORTR|nr:hypothetical protein [Portunus trituberculatus]
MMCTAQQKTAHISELKTDDADKIFYSTIWDLVKAGKFQLLPPIKIRVKRTIIHQNTDEHIQ